MKSESDIITIPSPTPRPKTKEEKGGEDDIWEGVFDASCLSCYKQCQRLFFWRYVLGLRPTMRGEGLMAGIAMHDALDLLYQGHSLKDCFSALDKIPAETADKTKGRGHMELILMEYVEEFLPEKEWEVLELECRFRLDMGMNRTFSGRVDMLVREGGKLWLVDHKTAKWHSQSKAKFDFGAPSMQMDGYTFALSEVLGEEVEGVILNMIATCMQPKAGPRFARYRPLRRPDLFPLLFHSTASRLSFDLSQTSTHQSEGVGLEQCCELWEMNDQWCGQFGGCPYLDLCLYGPRPALLSNFTHREGRKEQSDANPTKS